MLKKKCEKIKIKIKCEWHALEKIFNSLVILLRNTFRNNIDEELTVVRKTERDKETYKFVCFLA